MLRFIRSKYIIRTFLIFLISFSEKFYCIQNPEEMNKCCFLSKLYKNILVTKFRRLCASFVNTVFIRHQRLCSCITCVKNLTAMSNFKVLHCVFVLCLKRF